MLKDRVQQLLQTLKTNPSELSDYMEFDRSSISRLCRCSSVSSSFFGLVSPNSPLPPVVISPA